VGEGLLLTVSAGELLTEKGLVQREMFVIVDGLFEILDGERRIALLAAGEVVGEYAFFSTAGQRSASVRAAADGRVVVLRRRFIDGLRKTCAAELLFALARLLADRSVTSR
jgi:CRP-like cAMP-binding protein